MPHAFGWQHRARDLPRRPNPYPMPRLLALAVLTLLLPAVHAQEILLRSQLTDVAEAQGRKTTAWLTLGVTDMTRVFFFNGDYGAIGAIGGSDGFPLFDWYLITLHAGASHDLMSGPLTFAVGADLGIAQYTLGEFAETDSLGNDIGTYRPSSGMSPQQLTLFGEARTSIVAGRLGIFLDIGSGYPRDALRLAVANSDARSGLFLDVEARTAVQNWIINGGGRITAYLIDDFSANGGLLDLNGDSGQSALRFDARLGAAYPIGNGEVGLVLAFALANSNTFNFTGDGMPVEEKDLTYRLTGIPYARFSSENSPLDFYIKLAVQHEDADVGLPIIGDTAFAPWLGLTVGTAYRF